MTYVTKDTKRKRKRKNNSKKQILYVQSQQVVGWSGVWS